jgi:hypothetical protein
MVEVYGWQVWKSHDEIHLNYYKKGPPSEAHTCNHSYFGGRDQEECSSKAAWANSWIPDLEKTHHKKKSWLSGSSHKNNSLASVRP